MTVGKTPEMDADFARWYNDAFMDEGERRDECWKAVVDVAASASFDNFEFLVHLALDVAPPAGKSYLSLQEGITKTAGALCPSESAAARASSNREAQVLAACVLVRLFPTSPDAALAVVNATFLGRRKYNLPMDLAGMAAAALEALTESRHARPVEAALQLAAPKIDFELSDAAVEGLDGAMLKAELSRFRDVIRAATKNMVEGHGRVVKSLSRRLVLADEEHQILWWLFGGRSKFAELDFPEVSEQLRAFAFASDLASLTDVSPGPASISAILSRAGVSGAQVKVASAVEAVGLGASEVLVKSERVSPLVTPLHFALEKRVELAGDPAWAASWRAIVGFDAEDEAPQIALAEQFYRERLYLYVSG